MKNRSLGTIWRLGVKELWSLWRDPVMLVLIAFSFTVSVYTAATAVPETLHHVPIAIVDEDHSPCPSRSPAPSIRRSSCRPP
ncbi:ABC-type multidrug transport system, permease component OS=Castellaniella defragrans (strain DSM/ CCUG 39792 / 65Phen) OX=1437824 GN=BN940_12861 PE=3 SV=1 [Castellaniella denitrificans]